MFCFPTLSTTDQSPTSGGSHKLASKIQRDKRRKRRKKNKGTRKRKKKAKSSRKKRSTKAAKSSRTPRTPSDAGIHDDENESIGSDSTHDTIVFEEEDDAAPSNQTSPKGSPAGRSSSSDETTSGDSDSAVEGVDDPNQMLHTETHTLFDSLQRTTHFNEVELRAMQEQFRILANGGIGISQSQLLKLLAGMQQTLPGILADLNHEQHHRVGTESDDGAADRSNPATPLPSTPDRQPRRPSTAPWALSAESRSRSQRRHRRPRDVEDDQPDDHHTNVASDVIAARLFQMLNQNESGHVQFQDLVCVISVRFCGFALC